MYMRVTGAVITGETEAGEEVCSLKADELFAACSLQ